MVILKNSLRECRQEAHINQKELAAELGIARETIGKLERGDNQNPCYRLVYGLASYFGKPVEEIFQYEDESECSKLPEKELGASYPHFRIRCPVFAFIRSADDLAENLESLIPVNDHRRIAMV